MTIQHTHVLQPLAPSAESLSDPRRTIRAGGLLIHFDLERKVGGLYSMRKNGWTLFHPCEPDEFLQLLPAFDVVIPESPGRHAWLAAICSTTACGPSGAMN